MEEERERRLESLFEADLEARTLRCWMRTAATFQGRRPYTGFAQGSVHSHVLAMLCRALWRPACCCCCSAL